TEHDLERIYGRPDLPNLVTIGHLSSAESIPALIDLDALVTRHSAILGTTGTGKSTTVAGLLNSISDQSRFPSARVLVLDIHGEYASTFGGNATIYRINPSSALEQQLSVPYWALTFDELVAVTFGSIDGSGRGAVMDKVMQFKRQSLHQQPRLGVTEDSLTIDTPVPFSIHALWLDLYRTEISTHTVVTGHQSKETEALVLGDDGNPIQPGDALKVIPPKYRPQTQAAGVGKIYLSGSTNNIRRPLEALASKLRDPRFDFLFRPGAWSPDLTGVPPQDLDSLLEGWVGGHKPITILDLSGIPTDVLTTLVGVLLRLIYDALFWSRNLSEGGRERPLLIVMEEAHSYLDSQSGGRAISSVRRIVKEGRKYGIGILLVSQRPAEIDATILSQCGTIFAMRLSNPVDRSHVSGILPDHMEGLLSMLPTLRTGECIILGEAVHLPVRALIDAPPPNRRPDSGDPPVADTWNRPREPSDYRDVVAVWREQQPRSKRYVPNIKRIPVAERREPT
ncbi:MAG: ATP-binding protein, partial [Bacilli bacterium]